LSREVCGGARPSRYDRIYRGYDGRCYSRRNDGTSGLIIGAGVRALLGNQPNIGGSTTLSTVLGGAAGARPARRSHAASSAATDLSC